MVVVSAPPGSASESGGGPADDHGGIELLQDLDRPRAWMVMVDGTPQSYVDLDDPLYLEVEYIQRFGHALDVAAPPWQPLRVLHLGPSILSQARLVAATATCSTPIPVE